jgi:putative monooxygenase
MTDSAIRKVAVADVAANRRRGGDIRVLLSPKTVGSSSGFFGVLGLAVGEYVAEHYHPYSEEFIFVVSGSLSVLLDGDATVELAAGEGTMIPRHVRHRVSNAGTGPTSAVFHLSPLAPRPELGHVDTETLPDAGAPMLDVECPR